MIRKTIELTDIVCDDCSISGKAIVKSKINVIYGHENFIKNMGYFDAEVFLSVDKKHNKKEILPAVHFLSETIDEKLTEVIFQNALAKMEVRKININFGENMTAPDITLNIPEIYGLGSTKPVNYMVFNDNFCGINMTELIRFYGALSGTTFPSSIKLLKTSNDHYLKIKELIKKQNSDYLTADKYGKEIAIVLKGDTVNSKTRNRYLGNNHDINLMCISNDILISPHNNITIRKRSN